MSDFKVTKHAEHRVRNRVGVNKQSVDKLAEKALIYGLTHKETTGRLHKYLTTLFLSKHKANNMRVYNRQVFLFHGNVLLTVFPLPQNMTAMADKQQKRKESVQETA